MGNKRIVLTSLLRAQTDVQVYKRENIPLEKGVVLTEQYLTSIQDLLEKYMNFFTAYPDIFLDLIAPVDAQIKLFPYQRVFLRAVMRFKNVYVTACRAFSKSFITILGMVLQCIFMPRTKRFICAPMKAQAAQIAKEKLTEIFRAWPLLRREVIGGDLTEVPGNYGKDYVTLRFRNGSQFDVVGALESSLGGRRQGGLLDEIKLHDEELINTVVLPQDVKEGAFNRNINRTGGELMTKRCILNKNANGERKKPNPVPSYFMQKVQRLLCKADFVTV